MSLKEKLQTASDPAILVRKEIEKQLSEFNAELAKVSPGELRFHIIDTSNKVGSFSIEKRNDSVNWKTPILECVTDGLGVEVTLLRAKPGQDAINNLTVEEAIDFIENLIVNETPIRVRNDMFRQTDVEAAPTSAERRLIMEF